MKGFIRLLKAVGIALALGTLLLVAIVLIAWLKGVFFIIFGFTALVYYIYQQILRKERTDRRQKDGWLA